MLRNLDDFSASRLQNYAVVRRILTSLFLILSLTSCSAHYKAFETTSGVLAKTSSRIFLS